MVIESSLDIEKPNSPFSKSLLEEITTAIGYDIHSRFSGPDGKSDHTRIDGLERTCFIVLGTNIFDWEQKLSARESGFNNQTLGRKVFMCLKPVLPKTTDHLDGLYIMDALKIYEEDLNLSFAFYGTYTVDFVFTENLYRGKKNHYAFVFNTSKINPDMIKRENEILVKNPDYKGPMYGSHWVLLYFDIIKNQIDYYDSLGHPPSNQLKISFSRIVKFLKKQHLDLDLTINYSCELKQKRGNTCGIYVVHFIIQRLFGRSYKEINENISDETIVKYRNVYWTSIDKDLFDY